MRVEFKRLAELVRGLFQPPELTEGVPQVGARRHVVGPQPNGFRERGRRLGRAFGQDQDGAEIEPRACGAGVDANQLPEQRLGLRQPSRPQARHGSLIGLCDAQLWHWRRV